MVAQLPMKFLRAHKVSSVSNYDSFLYRLKLTYEFWGFCVNGSNDLKNPGGFASINPLNVPVGFESGSLYLSGSDGQTTLGTQFFSSSAGVFSENDVGRHLVAWKSGSTSSDDSIYQVTQFINSGVIRVDTFEGGTPYAPANDAPYFTDRSNINFRMVDIAETANSLTIASGNYMVLEFASASDINESQANSQIKIGFNYNIIVFEYRFHISPSGSWNGTGFTDGQEFYTNTGNAGGWTVNGGTGPGIMTMIADRCFLFHHGMGQADSGAAAWHDNSAGWWFEIPNRIYPKEIDQNPVVAISWGEGMKSTSTTGGFAAPYMIGRDGVTARIYEMFARSPHGISWDRDVFGGYAGLVDSNRKEACHDKRSNNILFSDCVLSRVNSDECTIARVRLRNMRSIPDVVLNDTLVGNDDGNKWWKIYDWVMLPWDGARLPGRFIIEF